jgi:hypothetical protein
MFHLVYASSATKSFTKPELQELLQKARRKNGELGLTGMLLYKDGNFMQVLEGQKDVVEKLAKTIEADDRHTGILVLLRRETKERNFADWSMGFRDLGEKTAVKIPGFNDFLNTPLTGAEFSSDPSRSMKLLLLFKKNM